MLEVCVRESTQTDTLRGLRLAGMLILKEMRGAGGMAWTVCRTDHGRGSGATLTRASRLTAVTDSDADRVVHRGASGLAELRARDLGPLLRACVIATTQRGKSALITTSVDDTPTGAGMLFTAKNTRRTVSALSCGGSFLRISSLAARMPRPGTRCTMAWSSANRNTSGLRTTWATQRRMERNVRIGRAQPNAAYERSGAGHRTGAH